MITADETTFPNNVVELLEIRLAALDAGLVVFKRPLRATDPNQCVGIVAAQWTPDNESLEMRGLPTEPTLSRYMVTVQAFIKDMDEIRGLNVHSVLSRRIRNMLYNDTPLRLALGSLSSTLDGATESARRWGVSQQRFFANEIEASWLYLSNLEFWLETETR